MIPLFDTTLWYIMAPKAKVKGNAAKAKGSGNAPKAKVKGKAPRAKGTGKAPNLKAKKGGSWRVPKGLWRMPKVEEALQQYRDTSSPCSQALASFEQLSASFEQLSDRHLEIVMARLPFAQCYHMAQLCLSQLAYNFPASTWQLLCTMKDPKYIDARNALMKATGIPPAADKP